VTNQDHVAQVLEMQQVDDLRDVTVKVDVGCEQVRTLAETGQRRRVHLVSVRSQQPSDRLVAPAAVAAAVNQDEGRHGALSPPSVRRMPRGAACLCANTHARGN
jgi:hypothetical protein